MVKRILDFLNQEVRGLHQAAYLLGFFSFLSQILALIRDRLLAHSFGASHALDIYYAAFRFPDFVFVAVASMVSISVLIPLLTSKIEKGGGEAQHFISSIFSVFSFAIVIASVILYVAMPKLLDIVFPKFIGDPYHEELISLSRILLLSPVLLGLSNFFASITQVYKRFFIYALSPLLYNIGIIVGILFLYPSFGLKGLAWGVVIGAFLHFFIQVPFVFQKDLFPRFTFKLNIREIWKVVSQSLPRTLALSLNEIAEFLLIRFASLMSVGAISIYNFAWNLQSVPLSIIGVSYSLAAFPTLSKLYATGNRESFLDHIRTYARHIIFLSLPVMSLFIVLRAQIVRVILGSGYFDWSDTRLTAATLAIFTLSLIPQSLVILLVRAYYSKGETKKPLFVSIFSSILIVVLGFVFTRVYEHFPSFHYFFESLFRVTDVVGTEVLMLPLAYSIGLTVNLILLWVMFENEFKGFSRSILTTLFQSFSVAVIMGYVAYFVLTFVGNFIKLDTFLNVFSQGFIAGIVAIVCGIVVFKIMKSQELEAGIATLKRKIWTTPVTVPEEKELAQ